MPNIVAIPAHNEAGEIAGCLQAIAAQRGARAHGVVLCLNNCTDSTEAIVERLAPSLPYSVDVLAVQLPPERACAGVARRIAMDRAALLAGPRGIVLTTDADGRVLPDWLAANLAAIAAGADAVAGTVDIDPAGAALIPAHLHAADAAECAYAAALDEIAWRLDPEPHDPLPRHDQHNGASIAVTVEAYRRAGGMPAIRLAEDRQFFDALRRVDARIRHESGVRVIVSARLFGRARGGMADTIRRRMTRMDSFLDDRLEPARDAARRAWLRALARRVWSGDRPVDRLAVRLQSNLSDVRDAMTAPWFGEAWERLQASSPRLGARAAIAVEALPREMARAGSILRRLAAVSLPERQGGSALPAIAARA